MKYLKVLEDKIVVYFRISHSMANGNSTEIYLQNELFSSTVVRLFAYVGTYVYF